MIRKAVRAGIEELERRTLLSIDADAGFLPGVEYALSDQAAYQRPGDAPSQAASIMTAPTNIDLSVSTIDENQPPGTTVGTLSTIDPDPVDTFTYSLVSGTGDDDNASFTIVGSELHTAASFNYEDKNRYVIRVQSTDSGGLPFQSVFMISVTNVNETPTDIALSSSVVEEKRPVGMLVGSFSTTDPDPGDSFSYSLVPGPGSEDNASFRIIGSELHTAARFDCEVKSSYSIRVHSTDRGGTWCEKPFTISVTPADRVAVQQLGQWGGGPVYAVAVSGGIGYIGQGGNLVAMDLSDPTHPRQLGNVVLPACILAMGVAGSYAYIADGYSGLQVIDISNPASPVRVGGYDTSNYTEGVSVVGNYAYIADGYSGLQVIDISNPASPVWVGGYDTSGQALGVSVAGSYAYVADEYMGLQVIDISNPASPVWVGGYDTSGQALGVSVVGNYAYVTDGSSGLQVIDISNRASPVWVGGYATSGWADGVDVAGHYAYMADGYSGLQVIDISNPASPVRVGGCTTSNHADGVDVVGRYAYMTDGYSGMQVIDISNPASPVRVGGYDTSNYAEGVDVVGSYAYVAEWSSGLQVIDISNPAAPVRVGGYDTSGYAYGVSVVGNYAYVADEYMGLQVIDISNPAAPVRVGGYDTSGQALGVSVVGNYAYVADGSSGLQVIDISNPAAPVRVGGYDTSGQALGVSVAGSYAYVADEYMGLQVIDISNPPSPVWVGGYDTSGQALGVSVVGRYAYVTDGSSGLQVIDISNPASPVWVGGYATSGWAVGMSIVGSYAYVADGSSGLVVLRANYPPTELLLSNVSVAENQPAGTLVGTLSSLDQNDAESFTYSLVSGSGSTDNALFKIIDNELRTTASFDYEGKNSYSIRIRSTDQGGLWYEKVFTISVTDVDEVAPTVTAVYVRGSTWNTNYLSFLAANTPGSNSTYGYAVPVGSGAAQLQTLPWRNLNRISIAFSENVSVAQAQFAIVGSVGSYSVSGFSYNAADHVATWSLSAAIGPDKLYVAVPGSGTTPVKDIAGNSLDGEWNNPSSYSQAGSTSSFPSGNGIAGGNFAFRLDVLPGDSTGGSLGKVNVADVAQTKSRSALPVTLSSYRSDFDGNNLMNVADVAYVKSRSAIYSLPVNAPVLPVFKSAFSQVSLLLSRKYSLLDYAPKNGPGTQ